MASFSQQALDRFWSNVDKSSGCWIHSGTPSQSYAKVVMDGIKPPVGAHRISWEIANGPIPDGLWVLHNCPGGDNKHYVNPDHLFLGTHADNMRDAALKGTYRHGDDHHMRRRPELVKHGSKNVLAKLTEDQAAKIRELYANGPYLQKELANMFGVNKRVIWCICLGRSYPALGVTYPIRKNNPAHSRYYHE